MYSVDVTEILRFALNDKKRITKETCEGRKFCFFRGASLHLIRGAPLLVRREFFDILLYTGEKTTSQTNEVFV